MKALITGANGMLGQDLAPLLQDNGWDVIETDIEQLDITDKKSVESVLDETNPDFVFHCAAYTNVEKAETDKDAAYLVNQTGAENIAKACKKRNITLVYISTDYVFDGEKGTRYEENDSVNPINTYGKSKLAGELAIKQSCEKFYIVRTSWLYGIHGMNFVEKILAQEGKSEISVVDDEISAPTWTVELAEKLVNIRDYPYGTYHFCGGTPISRYNFAKKIFELASVKTKVIPCKSSQFKTAAARPKYSAMKPSFKPESWEASLKKYLDLRI